jgi:hypothetical protein
MFTTLWKLPVPATAIDDGPHLEIRPGHDVAIRMGYEGDNDAAEQVILIFEGVEVFQFSYMLACNPTMLESYGKLIDRGSSEWLQSVRASVSRNGGPSGELKHLMILFDDGPCYEAACTAFRVERDESR